MHGLLRLKACGAHASTIPEPISITVSKCVGKFQQLSQSFDRKNLWMRKLSFLWCTIGVRPHSRNLHGGAIEVLDDEAM